MILGIDASNLRSGGGITHLVELLRAADPLAQGGFKKVIVWSGLATLERIEDRPWLIKRHQSVLDRGILYRLFWQRFRLSDIAHKAQCDALLVPGGAYPGNFHPIVAMSQNMLPFEWPELMRFGWSVITLRLFLLRLSQSHTFRKASGLIFLTQYAQRAVLQVIKTIKGKTIIVPHGIDKRFACPPREQFSISQYSDNCPFRILYVSIIDFYKHQWHVANAVAKLREEGIPVVLDLIGPSYPPAFKRLRSAMKYIVSADTAIRYSGAVPYSELPALYAQANICLFASSCENMPNILLEGMASGLPIACSNRGPMPEILGDTGVYFNPEKSNSIVQALRKLINSPQLRDRLAKASFERSKAYSWERCSRETFGFLAEIARSQIHTKK